MAPLSWSNTRITVLEYCQKKYFFNYYSDCLKSKYPELWKEIKILRKLKSMDMRMGEMTHKLLSTYLIALKKNIVDRQEEPNIEDIFEKISNKMKETFEISKKNDYSNFIDFGLSEHFYQEADDDMIQIVIKKIKNNLDAFIESEYHKKIEQRFVKGHHIYIENPNYPNFEMMKVDVSQINGLEDISVLANPDFGLMFGENNYLILDWKSGKESLDVSGITDQLRVYALKILLKQKKEELGAIKIDVKEIYLPSLNEKGGIIEQEDIDAIIEKIKEDVEYQKQFLVEQDAQRNEALNHLAFSRTNSEKKCASCTFRDVCKKLKDKE